MNKPRKKAVPAKKKAQKPKVVAVAKSNTIKGGQIRTAVQKKKLIEALEKSMGVVTTACASLKIDRSTHYKWLMEDESYRNMVQEIENVALDFAESKLHANIAQMDTTAIIFFLKTKGKNRGYTEKNTLDVNATFRQDLSHLSVDELEKLIGEAE
jgi:hypothetical protein